MIYQLSPLFVAVSFLALGYGAIITFISVYLKDSGSSDIAIGFINSAFYLGAILSSIFSQKIISTVGHIRSFASFASLMVISFLLHSIYLDNLLWAFLRLASGFSYYGLLIIIESWLNEKSTNEQRGQILAIYTGIFYLCIAFGQLFLNIDYDSTHLIFSIGAVLILFSLIIISLTKLTEPIIKPFHRYSIPKVYGVAPLAFVGSFIGGFFVGAFFTMIPLLVLAVFDSKQVVSIFMLISTIGGLLSLWPIGKLSDIFGRRKLLAFCGIFTAFVSLLFFVVPQSENYYYLLGFMLSIGIFAIYPLAVARANDVVDENKDIVEISRTLLFSYGFGSFVAPLFVGFIFSFLIIQFVFVLFAGVGLFMAFYALSKKRATDDELSVFVQMPIVSGDIVTELDPRHIKK